MLYIVFMASILSFVCLLASCLAHAFGVLPYLFFYNKSNALNSTQTLNHANH